MNFIIFTLSFLLSSLVPPTASKNCSGTIQRDNVNGEGSKGALRTPSNGYNHCEQIRSCCWGNSRRSAPRVRASLQFSVNYPESGASSSLLIPPEVKPIAAVNQELCCASHLLRLDLGCMIETGQTWRGGLGCWEALCSYAKSIADPSVFCMINLKATCSTHIYALISLYHILVMAVTLHESTVYN